MPGIAGNGLPVSSKKNLALRSGLFELVDAKFRRGLTDKKYTLREILSSGSCEVLLPPRDKFYRYVKAQVQSEKPSHSRNQYLLLILAGLCYIPSIILGFYKSVFITADKNITGESHHSLILHDYTVVWGDYVVPFIITCCIAGIYPWILLCKKTKSDKKTIKDILDSVEAEREDTIKEHKLIACFFTLCEIVNNIKIARYTPEDIVKQQNIKTDLLSVCRQFKILEQDILGAPGLTIYYLDLEILSNKIKDFLLSKKFSGIFKSIICKIRGQIAELQVISLLKTCTKQLNPNFEKSLGESIITKYRILDIIACISAEKIDVREDPLPLPIFLTRDLDLLGVREALFEYWGDLPPDELVIHYTIDFNHLSKKILIEYSKLHPEDFYHQSARALQRPMLRQAPFLEYNPEPVRASAIPSDMRDFYPLVP